MSNGSINILTEEQARQLIREELQSFFQENPVKADHSQPEAKVVDLTGLLKARPFIGSRSTLYKKAYQGLIPHSKRGKKLYFDLTEIDNWLLANKANAISQPENRPAKSNRRSNG